MNNIPTWNSNAEIGACDNCDTEGIYVKKYIDRIDSRNINEKREFSFCFICATTFLSHATTYPSQCSVVKLYKSIGTIANVLLKEIQSLKKE